MLVEVNFLLRSISKIDDVNMVIIMRRSGFLTPRIRLNFLPLICRSTALNSHSENNGKTPG